MTRPNFWSKSAPRVELDHRARDARVRLVQTERLLVPRGPVASFWLSPFVRLLGSRAGGKRRNGSRGDGSQSNPRLDCYVRYRDTMVGSWGDFCRNDTPLGALRLISYQALRFR
jgi:hypothetical protein